MAAGPVSIAARRCAREASGADSMITRHGRSASTVSSVLPNSDAPSIRRGSGITIAAARMSPASSMIRRPAWPARIFSTWPETRRPPWISRLLDRRVGGRLLVSHPRLDRQRVRHRDEREHVDAAPLARRELLAVAITCSS